MAFAEGWSWRWILLAQKFLSPIEVHLHHADLVVRRGLSGGCPRPVAKLSLREFSLKREQYGQESDVLCLALGSSLKLVDLTIGSVAFDTLDVPIHCNAAVRLPG